MKKLAVYTGNVPVVEKGEKGATERFREWDDIPENESLQSGADGDTYIDYVVYQEDWYVCILSHYKNSQQYKPTNGTFWQKVSEQSRIATKLLLATKSFIKNLQVDEVVITDQGEGKGNVLLRATKDGIECKQGNFENITASGVFRSRDEKNGNYITIDAKEGSILLEGPSKVDVFTGKPTSDSITIPLAYLCFMTDSEKGERFAQLRLDAASGGKDILVSANNGIYLEYGAGTANINYVGMYYNRFKDNKVFSKTWEEILS